MIWYHCPVEGLPASPSTSARDRHDLVPAIGVQLLGLEGRLAVQADSAERHAPLRDRSGQGTVEPQLGEESAEEAGRREFEEVAAG